jgi:hypothetical protein
VSTFRDKLHHDRFYSDLEERFVMPRTKIPKSRTAMEAAIPPTKPDPPREVRAQTRRSGKVVELPDPLPCPYCRSAYTDLQTKHGVNTQGEYAAHAQVVCKSCAASGPAYQASSIAGSVVHVRKALEAWNRVAA